MLIERLKLNDFRNYESLLLRPDSGLNVIVGENAQGKTNAVEAIFLCAFGRSHRTAKDAELIRAGFAGGYVGMDIRAKSGGRTIEIKLKSGERKQIFIDKLMAKRTGELLHDATSCAMCRRQIINAGLEKVVIRRTETEFEVVPVQQWIDEDDSL